MAAISLSIALAIIIGRKKNSLYISFAGLCLSVFIAKSAAFFAAFFDIPLWQVIKHLGVLLMPPMVVSFGRYLLRRETFLSRHVITLVSLASAVIISVLFTPLAEEGFMPEAVYIYSGSILVYGFVALTHYIYSKPSGVDRKRILYVLVACSVAAVLSISDLLHYGGFGFPLLSDIAVAALLYFVLMIITHPELPELYEIMLKGLLVFCIIVFASMVFYLSLGLFGGVLALPFTSVLMASFIIVIFMDPVKDILQRAFSHFFFDKRELSVSLYPMDERVQREKAQLLEEMATGLAHEIRNPLGSIKGAAQYLKTETLPKENGRMLDVIIEEADRLNRVVSQFLNYARPDIQNMKRQSVNRIVDKVVTMLRTTELPYGIEIHTCLDPELPEISIDGEQFMQVILNIALNGIDSMPEGGQLNISTVRDEESGKRSIKVIISDTGQGIAREELKNIFRPFYTTKDKGTGLGLSICERIIKNHGGIIDVDSKAGEGTNFTIRV